jgi:hypothetical protein
VTNRAGHKLPSGVGFRRAFLEFAVLDAGGQVLWASGRTDGAGRDRRPAGEPIAGELWWNDDCSELLPDERRTSRTTRRSPARTRRRSTRSW